jgi:hypothetical protein
LSTKKAVLGQKSTQSGRTAGAEPIKE